MTVSPCSTHPMLRCPPGRARRLLEYLDGREPVLLTLDLRALGSLYSEHELARLSTRGRAALRQIGRYAIETLALGQLAGELRGDPTRTLAWQILHLPKNAARELPQLVDGSLVSQAALRSYQARELVDSSDRPRPELAHAVELLGPYAVGSLS